MHTLCQPNEDKICTQCNQKVDPQQARNCPAKGRVAERISQPMKQVQLGDAVQSFFESVGVTKERYLAAKEALNLAPECGCDYRRELLNGVGQHLGINNALTMFAEWRRSSAH